MSIKLEIKDTFAFVDIHGTCKTVKLESIIKAFSSVNVAIESPILPMNCIKYKEKGNAIDVLLYHEPTRFTATVGNEKFENCLRPGLILKYGLTKSGEDSYSISNSACFGVKDPYIMLRNTTRLYGLPFPNIGTGGWICWGSNSAGGTVTSLVGLRSYIERLFSSPFNTHLFNSSLLNNTHQISTPQGLFKYLQTLDRWDDSLFETANGVTIGSL